ncbi:MAG: radical SAM protein [Thermoanaerobaculales bacterium]|nr:radical SAM protein [Thermoanaerobaculales bacterium]
MSEPQSVLPDVTHSDDADDKVTVLRITRGTCPICIEIVDARLIVESGRVLLEKNCPDHGKNRALLSESPAYFAELLEFYHDILPQDLPQRDFILRLTARCNMRCPICLASSDQFEEEDLPKEQLAAFLKGRGRRLKLDLMGAEPTVRDDLAEIIRMADQGGHITALHTNGLEITDPAKLKKLVDAGLKEVHLQFDGFEDEHDLVLRGRPMRAVREKVLAALEQYGVATDLVVTILRGLNENQMEPVLTYAAEHPFVKEVFYLGCRRLGRATDDFADQVIAPDELIDDLERETSGRISREDIRIFQKLYFSLLAVFRVRKCFYIHHYIVIRTRDGYRPLSEQMDLAYLEPRLERFRRMIKKSRLLSVPYLMFHCGISVLRKGGLALLVDGMLLSLLLALGFDLSRIKRRIILVGFISACDPWIHDIEISANCGKGEVATDIGVHEAGADANVERERVHREAEKKSTRVHGIS